MLLLRELLKQTPDSHLDLISLKQALEKVEQINKIIDINIEVTREQKKMIELQEKLGMVSILSCYLLLNSIENRIFYIWLSYLPTYVIIL